MVRPFRHVDNYRVLATIETKFNEMMAEGNLHLMNQKRKEFNDYLTTELRASAVRAAQQNADHRRDQRQAARDVPSPEPVPGHDTVAEAGDSLEHHPERQG